MCVCVCACLCVALSALSALGAHAFKFRDFIINLRLHRSHKYMCVRLYAYVCALSSSSCRVMEHAAVAAA